MKRTILLTAIAPLFALAFLFSFHAQAAPQHVATTQSDKANVIRVIRVGDHWRAITVHYRPDPQRLNKRAFVAEPAVSTECSYDFFGEECEYDPSTGFILCIALYWSESCQQGMICYNWIGSCGSGCNLVGECVAVDSTWLLN